MWFRCAVLWMKLACVLGFVAIRAEILFSDEPRPNIVIILADDLGAHDLGCYGRSEHATPRLDQLAMEGIRFDYAYAAAPVCSPSRACILTGKSPARLNLTTFLPGRPDQPSQRLIQPMARAGLPLEEKTIAEHLKEVGYATACIGKWHLGDNELGPMQQGFDLYWPGKPATSASGQEIDKGERGLIDKSIEFIRNNARGPFFLYLCHHSPHIPLAARPELQERFSKTFNPVYAAMLHTLDQETGRLLDLLDEEKLRQNTIVLFSSDNGGLHVAEGPLTPATLNDPLRGGKGYLYEGGLRVPLLMRWPGHIPAGQVVGTPVSHSDWFPSLLELAGLPPGESTDGVSLQPLFSGKDLNRSVPLCWHFPHYSNQGGRPSGAIRRDQWKLIEDYETGTCELFNLATDPAESKDQSSEEPARVAELRGQLEAWRRSQNGVLNRGNLAYKPDAETMSRGIIRLEARDAQVHGSTLHYEESAIKDTLGCWSDADDYPEWTVQVPSPGDYQVDLLYGCGPGNGGSRLDLRVGQESLPFQVEETGHFQRFVTRNIGTVTLPSEQELRLEVRVRSKPSAAVMDLRRVTLTAVRPPPSGARPDINAGFLAADLNVEEWLSRFEVESREIFTARRDVLAAMQLSPNSRVADIGAGTGLYTLMFSEAVPEGWVFGLDISPKFIEHLRDRTSQSGRSNVSCVLSSQSSVDLPPGSIDRAFICDTYHHFEDPPQILKSIKEALKPGGMLIVIDFERIPGRSRDWVLDHVRGGKETFCREITTAGFEYLDEVQIPGFSENYLVRFRRP